MRYSSIFRHGWKHSRETQGPPYLAREAILRLLLDEEEHWRARERRSFKVF